MSDTNKKLEEYISIIESHKPKHFKYKYIIKDDEFNKTLLNSDYDMNQLDTINNTELCYNAIKQDFETYDRSIIKKAKEPYIVDDGLIISKKMITKADKKLNNIQVAKFEYNRMTYCCVKFVYEKFDIIELFIVI